MKQSMLLVFSLLAVIWITGCTGTAFFGQASFEFVTNRTFPFTAKIYQQLQLADNLQLNVSMTVNCTEPISFKFGKCDILIFRYGNVGQEKRNSTFIFDKAGIAFLLETVQTPCYGSYYSDGSVEFIATATTMTTCKFIVKLAGLETDFSKFTLVETPTKPFYFYVHEEPEEEEETSEVLKTLGGFFGFALFFLCTIFISRFCISDGFGEDQEEVIGKADEEVTEEPAEEIAEEVAEDAKEEVPEEVKKIMHAKGRMGKSIADKMSEIKRQDDYLQSAIEECIHDQKLKQEELAAEE